MPEGGEEPYLDYREYRFTVHPLQPATEILIAELADVGFESFVETNNGVLAYIQEAAFRPDILHGLHILSNSEVEITYQSSILPRENWNARWESEFRPIVVDNRCMVRAPFHPPSGLPYEIVIEPKMSFGTGHHETTHLMLQFLLDEELQGKKVLDMGCGTGVLAILAAMRGAKTVEAVDIDPWSYENTVENAHRNGQDHIVAALGDASLLGTSTYDLVLANINRNILLEDLPTYVQCLEPGGALLLSGFYSEDLDAISGKCKALGLRVQKNIVKNNWVSAKYVF